MISNLSKDFDYKDIQILRTLDASKESKVSTMEISEKLNIPGRSIRYRINRLKDKGILKEKTVIAHERKLGIRESFILIRENSIHRKKLLEIINENKAINWFVPIMGKYNGYLAHAINIVNVPNYPNILLKKMKKIELVQEFNIFELIDYKEEGWNYDYFNENGEWTWKWEDWYKKIKNEESVENELNFAEKPINTSFDHIDIQILKYLYLKPEVTQKKISKTLSLSESQISRRIKSLEQNSIIRGYRTGFNPYLNSITFLCIFNLEKNANEIIGYLKQIPYPKTIAFGSKGLFALGIVIPVAEVKGILNCIHLLSTKTKGITIQFYLQEPSVNIQNFFDLYDTIKNNWMNIKLEYEKTIKKFLN